MATSTISYNNTSITLDEYNQYIKSIIMKLFSENSIKFVTKPNNNYVYEFTPPEWYTELDSDTQSCVFSSIQATLKDMVKKTIEDMNKNKE